jgi:hypothetical protein
MALNDATWVHLFGIFAYREAKDGAIVIDPAWVAQNIRTINAPFAMPTYGGGVTRRIQCHRLVVKSLLGALGDLADQGLESLITFYGGMFVPRHQYHRASNPLSRHSWGAAIDLNPTTYPVGAHIEQDDQLIEIMAAHGFGYGGGHSPGASAIARAHALWRSTQDPMHMEWALPQLP